MRRTTLERFQEKIKRIGECDVWIGAKNRAGYGEFRYRGKQERAHRVTWLMVHKSIPIGMCVLHTCDNPSCVRIGHLFLGTQKDNIDDKMKKGRFQNGGDCTAFNAGLVPHGTLTGVRRYKCRCNECLEAKRNYDREYNARKH